MSTMELWNPEENTFPMENPQGNTLLRYMKEIQAYPLLSREEELALAAAAGVGWLCQLIFSKTKGTDRWSVPFCIHEKFFRRVGMIFNIS